MNPSGVRIGGAPAPTANAPGEGAMIVWCSISARCVSQYAPSASKRCSSESKVATWMLGWIRWSIAMRPSARLNSTASLFAMPSGPIRRPLLLVEEEPVRLGLVVQSMDPDPPGLARIGRQVRVRHHHVLAAAVAHPLDAWILERLARRRRAPRRSPARSGSRSAGRRTSRRPGCRRCSPGTSALRPGSGGSPNARRGRRRGTCRRGRGALR